MTAGGPNALVQSRADRTDEMKWDALKNVQMTDLPPAPNGNEDKHDYIDEQHVNDVVLGEAAEDVRKYEKEKEDLKTKTVRDSEALLNKGWHFDEDTNEWKNERYDGELATAKTIMDLSKEAAEEAKGERDAHAENLAALEKEKVKGKLEQIGRCLTSTFHDVFHNGIARPFTHRQQRIVKKKLNKLQKVTANDVIDNPNVGYFQLEREKKEKVEREEMNPHREKAKRSKEKAEAIHNNFKEAWKALFTKEEGDTKPEEAKNVRANTKRELARAEEEYKNLSKEAKDAEENLEKINSKIDKEKKQLADLKKDWAEAQQKLGEANMRFADAEALHAFREKLYTRDPKKVEAELEKRIDKACKDRDALIDGFLTVYGITDQSAMTPEQRQALDEALAAAGHEDRISRCQKQLEATRDYMELRQRQVGRLFLHPMVHDGIVKAVKMPTGDETNEILLRYTQKNLVSD